MKGLYKKRIKTIVMVLVIAMLCTNGLTVLALDDFTAERNLVSPRKVFDDVYISPSILESAIQFKDTWVSYSHFGSRAAGIAHSPVLFAANDDDLASWQLVHDGGNVFYFSENYIFTIVYGWSSGLDYSTVHYSEDGFTWYEALLPSDYNIESFRATEGRVNNSLDYLMFVAYDDEYTPTILITEDFIDWIVIEDYPEIQDDHYLYATNLFQGDSDDWYIYSHFWNPNRETAEDAYGITHFYKSEGLPASSSDWEMIGEYEGIATIAYTSNGDGVFVDTYVYPDSPEDAYGYGSAFSTIGGDWSNFVPLSQGSLTPDLDLHELVYRDNYLSQYTIEYGYGDNARFYRGVSISTDGGATFFVPTIYWEDEQIYPIGPTDGADDWAVEELGYAFLNGLNLDMMIGRWTAATNRLLAAEIIVNLIESITEKTIEEVAAERGFDMNVSFSDTYSTATRFLKASGISTGVDGVNYDPTGTFTRIQMVTMLGRMAAYVFDVDLSAYPLGSATFTDLPDWSGTDEAVGWAVAANVTNGIGGGLFDSDSELQNQHTGVFAYRTFMFFRV